MRSHCYETIIRFKKHFFYHSGENVADIIFNFISTKSVMKIFKYTMKEILKINKYK